MKDDWIYLRHIAESIEDIERYTAAGRGAFLADRMQQDAVIRKLEVIGEAVRRRKYINFTTISEIASVGLYSSIPHEMYEAAC